VIRLAPSILSADFSRIGEAIRLVEKAGADVVHLDVMDGHFVPNLTLGPQAVSAVRKITKLPIDVHLMVENPGFFIPIFHEAGADWISIHIEASTHLHRDISLIKDFGRKAGVVLNPATPIQVLSDILKELDFVLLMSVNPGFGGQKFIASTRQRIRELRSWIDGRNFSIPIEVDGGIDTTNAEGLIRDGAEILVVGAAIFTAEDPVRVIARLREIMARVSRP
jgi:ribulose-phosphate 3-epimerase